MKTLLKAFYSPSAGLLVLRLGAGAIFLYAGISKLTNIQGTIQFFGTLDFQPWVAWLVAIAETVGGGMLVLGLATSVASVWLIIIMIVAIIKVKYGNGFGVAQIDMMLLVSSLAILLSGPGRFSFANVICRCDCGDCGDGQCCGVLGVCSHGHGKKSKK